MFLPCYISGCNRKYKSETKWLHHLQLNHGITEPSHIPDRVAGDSGKNPNKPQFSVSEKMEKLKKQQEELQRLIDQTNVLTETSEPIQRVERLNRCNICLESGQFESMMIARQCGHGGFCSTCISSYGLQKCPVCRADTTFVKLFI